MILPFEEALTHIFVLFSLSRLGLELQDLPVRLLSRLRSLERWDLSGNRLQELPKNLDLPALRYLDLSDNQMEDVTTLECLQGVEELKMEDNLYITVRTQFNQQLNSAAHNNNNNNNNNNNDTDNR